jgi:hypothetical protein
MAESTYRRGMLDDDQRLAVAEGGPMEGVVLGPAGAERYEIRTAAESLHRYMRSGLPRLQFTLFRRGDPLCVR